MSAREVDALRAERLGEDLVYFYQVNDRSYTMPPGSQGLYEVMRTDAYIVSLTAILRECAGRTSFLMRCGQWSVALSLCRMRM